jgi:PST family polysaccharide transporter
VKRPLRNVLAFLLGDAGSRLIGFLITVYLARVLNPAGFGILNVGLAVLGHLSLLASPGINVLEARNVAASSGVRADRISGVLVTRMLLAAGICTGTWLVVRVVLPQTPTGDVVLLFVCSLFPMALLLDWFFQGKEQMGPVSISRLLSYVLYGLIVVLMVRAESDVVFAPVGFLLGNVAAALFLVLVFRHRFGPLSMSWQPALVKNVLSENIPVGGAMFLAQMVVNLPPLVIVAFLGNTDVGLFGAAMKIVFFFLLVDRLFNTLFLPVVTRYVATHTPEVRFLLSVTLKLIALVMLPVTAGGIFLAPWLMKLIYASGYEGGAHLLQILMAYALLTVLNSVFVCTVLGGGHERQYVRIMVIGTAVLVVALLVLTPVAGSPGAALGVVISEATVVILMLREARTIADLPGLRVLLWPLIGTGVMVAAALALQPVSLPAGVAVGLLLYLAIVHLGGGVGREEFRYLRERFV